MNFCCACLLCALAIATESVYLATVEPCAIALPCDARLPLANLAEQPHPLPVPPTLGARWTAETSSVTVSAVQPSFGRPTTQGH
jgi:hypothetical protein